MAKLNLKATGRGESAYSAFTKGYRQSTEVEDRRYSQFRPTSTNPMGGSHGGRTTVASNKGPSTPDETTPDDYGGNTAEFGPALKSGQTRKVDPEEAIKATTARQ